VIDNSGYVPRHVRDSAQLLKDAAEFYLFTSTAGVYEAWYDGTWPEGETDEDAPLSVLPEPGSEEVGKWYGQLKVLCEQEVQEAFPGRNTISRPGLIIGPGDSTDRFTYYPLRVAQGGEMIAFGNPTDPVQYIDARDLAAFCLHCVEQRIVGVFNTLGPRKVFTMGEMLEGIKTAIGVDTEFTWVPPDFLIEWEVIGEGMMGAVLMPWIPQDGTLSGAARFARERAFSNGLVFRPFAEIARDTLEWFKSRPEDRQAQMRAGLRGGDLPPAPASIEQQMEREAKVLAAWHATT
jgi:2'-hydroxyisoflavone reductase